MCSRTSRNDEVLEKAGSIYSSTASVSHSQTFGGSFIRHLVSYMLFRLILLLFSIRLCSFTAYKSLFETLLARLSWSFKTHIICTHFSRYNKIAFPSGEFNNTLTIEFKLRLDQIVDVHEKDQVITLKGTLIHVRPQMERFIFLSIFFVYSTGLIIDFLGIPMSLVTLLLCISLGRCYGSPI